VLTAGRMLVRNIAMVFDRYLGQQTMARFSRTV
jgi:oxygen-independent coproporphyrinogen III oxidase